MQNAHMYFTVESYSHENICQNTSPTSQTRNTLQSQLTVSWQYAK